jgi:hypothetical protein
MAFCRGLPHPKQQLLLNAQVDKGEERLRREKQARKRERRRNKRNRVTADVHMVAVDVRNG